MIESIEIENFRCFQHVSLSGLKRVNVVVGRNASGKTALLEAIFLATFDNLGGALRYKAQRGLGDAIQFGPGRESYESLWRDLFFSFDQSRIISVRLRGLPTNTRSVTIFYSKELLGLSKELLGLPAGEFSTQSAGIIPIEAIWVGSDQQEHRRQVTLTPEGKLNFGPPAPTPFQSMFFSTSHRASVKEAADRFSTLSKRNEEFIIVDAVRRVFPYVEGLSLETYSGQPMVHAKVRGIDEKVPLGFVSEGISRVLNVLLGITGARHGVVLVDEIETGIYHDRLADVWRHLLRFCADYSSQLFVTTHSLEALRALGDVLKDDEEQFALLRAERRNGECSIRAFKGSELHSALKQEVEVR